MYHAFYSIKVELFFVEGNCPAIEYPHPKDPNKVYIESVERQPYYLQIDNQRATSIEVVISLDGINPLSPSGARSSIKDKGIFIDSKSSIKYRTSDFIFPREFNFNPLPNACPGSIGLAFWHIREDGTRSLNPLWVPVIRYESAEQLKELGIKLLNPDLAHRESSKVFV